MKNEVKKKKSSEKIFQRIFKTAMAAVAVGAAAAAAAVAAAAGCLFVACANVIVLCTSR